MRLCLLALGLTGCLSSAQLPGVTPAQASQVASCQSIARTHNAIVVGDFVLGGATSSLATVSAALSPSADPATKTGLAIGAAIAGGIAMTGTALAGYTASDFANSQCSSVVGALPAGP